MKLFVVASLLFATMPIGAVTTCVGLKSVAVPRAKITLAESVAAGDFPKFADLPAFCRVQATLAPSSDSDIKVEVWLPVAAKWNGKFRGTGNGGLGGGAAVAAGPLANAIRDGYAAAGIQGIREGSSNAPIALPSNVRGYPGAVAQAVSRLRLAGVNGPYALVLDAESYTAASGGSDQGYPIFHHLERVVDGGIIWAPAIEGGFVVTTRGGDFELDIGQDISIGYHAHSSTAVELYFQETFTFRLLTTEAAVVLAPGEK